LRYKNTACVHRISAEINAGIVKFPEEKIWYEVATMRYIAEKTTIPVPKIYGWGTAEENPTGLGPFMIMEYIEHERTLSEALKDPALGPKDPHILDPNIDEQSLSSFAGRWPASSSNCPPYVSLELALWSKTQRGSSPCPDDRSSRT
jgi:hypothetical protein